MCEDYSHNGMYFSSGKQMQLDIFVLDHKLGLEYQGEQHYWDVFALGPKWRYSERDEEKRVACKENGITLIEVPYWWDKEKSSLMATIHEKRQDLIGIVSANPILIHPPIGFPKSKFILIFNSFNCIIYYITF